MTTHKILNYNSNNIAEIQSESVDLIVTSPPYPMIEMWDDLFTEQDSEIGRLLKKNDGIGAFRKMHNILNDVWVECDRVLKRNGFVCINIGDATRTIDGIFQLYSNHTEIINTFLNKGYCVLPDIHWRKQTNAPNKYMGSGMYPAGAYVTYEHEYILIFRKGGKRIFSGDKKNDRQESAFFWEERNVWFSDLWDLKGASQSIQGKKSRVRNASYPFEIPYRLINMYSVKNDTVLDPFWGLGTTSLACMMLERNSIGVEIKADIVDMAKERLTVQPKWLNDLIDARIERHLNFIDSLPDEKKEHCYINENHNFKVKTKQEQKILFKKISNINRIENMIVCEYE